MPPNIFTSMNIILYTRLKLELLLNTTNLIAKNGKSINITLMVRLLYFAQNNQK